MHSKIIDSSTSGTTAVYNNKSSSVRAVNYLNKENKEKSNGIFFDDSKINIHHQDVINSIDGNVKGLKKNEDKFDSIIISPSSDELKHIGNDNSKLIEYARIVMANYAANFDFSEKPKAVKIPVTLLDHGSAKYKFDEEKSLSYFIKFKDASGVEREIWGIDLKQAMDNTSHLPGSLIHIDHLGIKEVPITVKIKQPDGSFLNESKIVKRNEWEVVTDEYRLQNPLPIPPPVNHPIPDVLWYASIHHSREYEKKDEKVSAYISDLKKQGLSKLEVLKHIKSDMLFLKYKSSIKDVEYFFDHGPVKKGSLKPGDNRHIHIIASRRDKSMKTTLNNSNRNRFDRRNFFEKNKNSFELQYGYEFSGSTLTEKRERMIRLRIEHMNKKYSFSSNYLDADSIMKIYQNPKFSHNFQKNFWKLDNNFKKGIFPADPELFLMYGSDRIIQQKDRGDNLIELIGTMKSIGNSMGDKEEFDPSEILKNIRRKRTARLRSNHQEKRR